MSNHEIVQESRRLLEDVPVREYFEVPGKPDVIYEVRDYSKDPEKGAESARSDLPFLFKPFEVGQKPPPTKGQKPPFGREPTIHEYLDWTVTAASNLESLDFAGFRVLTLLPRYRPNWPPPDNEGNIGTKVKSDLGAPLDSIPLLSPLGKPISAATIRSGNGYIEVPFFATKQSSRGKGYGKALLYAIEDICRFLKMSKIMLCSTDDPPTISTWQHLGFRHTLPNELTEWRISPTDLVHMTNTVQMVKMVQDTPEWRSIRVKHQGFEQRIYFIKNSVTEKQKIVGKKRKEELKSDIESPSKVSRTEVENDIDVIKVMDGVPPNSIKNGIISDEILPTIWETSSKVSEANYQNRALADHERKISPSEQKQKQKQQQQQQQISATNKRENTIVGLSSDFG